MTILEIDTNSYFNHSSDSTDNNSHMLKNSHDFIEVIRSTKPHSQARQTTMPSGVLSICHMMIVDFDGSLVISLPI